MPTRMHVNRALYLLGVDFNELTGEWEVRGDPISDDERRALEGAAHKLFDNPL